MLEGADIYVTASPCFGCFKLIANAGMKRIVFGEFYRDERIFSLSEKLGIVLEHLPIEACPDYAHRGRLTVRGVPVAGATRPASAHARTCRYRSREARKKFRIRVVDADAPTDLHDRAFCGTGSTRENTADFLCLDFQCRQKRPRGIAARAAFSDP